MQGSSRPNGFGTPLLSGVLALGLLTAPLAQAAGNQAPTADTGGPYSTSAGIAITFDGTGSDDPDVRITVSVHFGPFFFGRAIPLS
jgi:hypothetical protein